jgi:hypothetical protein
MCFSLPFSSYKTAHRWLFQLFYEGDVMKDSHGKLSLETILETIKHSDEAREQIARLEPFMAGDPKCASLHATYLVLNLFSGLSSNEANISRIVSNLEMAAADLEMIAGLIRNLTARSLQNV